MDCLTIYALTIGQLGGALGGLHPVSLGKVQMWTALG